MFGYAKNLTQYGQKKRAVLVPMLQRVLFILQNYDLLANNVCPTAFTLAHDIPAVNKVIQGVIQDSLAVHVRRVTAQLTTKAMFYHQRRVDVVVARPLVGNLCQTRDPDGWSMVNLSSLCPCSVLL